MASTESIHMRLQTVFQPQQAQLLAEVISDSYNELVSARRELIDQHELLRPRSGTMDNPQVEAKTLSPLEQQLVSLAENLVLFERLVHALDFAGDIYDRATSVRFTHRIRPDARFASVEELTTQLRLDCDEAARLLGLR